VAELVMAFLFSMVRRLVDGRDQTYSPILETAPKGLARFCGEGYKRYQARLRPSARTAREESPHSRCESPPALLLDRCV
jgi:hypothetical protein